MIIEPALSPVITQYLNATLDTLSSMFDRPEMSRHPPYSCPSQYASRQQELPEQYPTANGTSNAFIASTNPNEDWTKISNLAERRKIQNRIAQRNYRKKLKRRRAKLEDRTGFDLAFPRQRAFQLLRSGSVSSMHAPSTKGSRPRSTSSPLRRDDTPDAMAQTYVLPSSGDRGMFSQQYMHQLSISSSSSSPYASLYGEDASANYVTYSRPDAYYDMPPTMDIPSHSSYIQPMHQACATSIETPPIKQDFYAEDDFSPFSMSYASISGIDLSTTVRSSYQNIVAAYTSSLSGSIEQH